MKKLYLIDVSSMFFRAFYAVRPLTSPSGVPVNAVYGFLSMIIKLLKEEKPEYVAFCYDRKDPSFRKDMYDDYKANRSEMPEELAVQIPYIKKLADLLGIPSFEVPKFEADDLIGTISHWGCKNGFEVYIVSGDKDFGQLVNDCVWIYDTMKDVRLDPAGVKEKMGVPPEQIIDYLAIVGDSSDNVPGVKGIGPKGAVTLLEDFKSLEGIYENLDKISSKSVKAKLEASRDMAFLSKKLVTIVTDVPMKLAPETYKLRPIEREALRGLLQELNFKSFEKSLLGEGDGAAATAADAVAAGYPGGAAPPRSSAGSPAPSAPIAPMPIMDADVLEFRRTPAEIDASIRKGQPLWGFADERGVFLASGGEIWLPEGDLKDIGAITDRKQVKWNGFDLKELWHRIGASNPVAQWDSMLAAYVYEARDTSDPAKQVLDHLGQTLPEMATPAQTLILHKQLKFVLEGKLAERKLEDVYLTYELPLIPILLRMEKRGIRLDSGVLAKESASLESEIAALEKEIHGLAGESFTIGSPKQLGHILFEKLGLEATKKTKTGYSTDSDVLEKLAHPIAALVLQWRELSKLKSTYVDALPTMADENGRVHTHFDQALTATGRLSSTSPNLQNIPIRTERGRRVRQAFIADEGKKLLSIDYSQIELRVLAHISEDPGLIKAFQEDLDIHAATAAEVFQVKLADVTSDMRRTAKAVNFGIAYGQGAFGLAEVLGIPRGESQQIIARYFERFKGVRDYIENTTKSAHEKGFVETLSGRRRYLPELSGKNPALRKFGERAAINAPIQGTAADLVKKAMIDLQGKIRSEILLQVHDELIFEGPEDLLREESPLIGKIMEGVAALRVPLKVNAAIGLNWDEAH